MKNICLNFFSLQKFDKNKSFIQKQPPQGFFKKVFLKNSENSPENTCVGVSFLKRLQVWGLQLFKKETPTQVFSGKFCEIFKIIIFTEHLPAIASICTSSLSFILQRSFIYLFKPSFVGKMYKNSQFCHLFILQIHFILYIVNVFYRSKYKHRKLYFVNEIFELYL